MAAPGDAAFAHCRRLIAQADKGRYWAGLYAPEDRRDALYALYAFDFEIAAVPDRVRDPMAGEIRLQWWREVLEDKRAEEAAANPVAAALLSALQHYQINAEALPGLIEARRFDLHDEPMTTAAELETYAQATMGTIFNAAAQILGGSDAHAEQICNEAGVAKGYLNAMRALGRVARDHRHIPSEILDRFGADRAAITEDNAPFELRAALAEMRLRARKHLASAGALLPRVSQQILPALLPAALIRPTLARMEEQSYDPLRPPQLSPLRQQWLIWRAARNPKRIFQLEGGSISQILPVRHNAGDS